MYAHKGFKVRKNNKTKKTRVILIHKLSWVARLFKRSTGQVSLNQSEKNARFIVEEMEPRKLFSADPLGGLLESDNFELPQVETLIVDHVSESYNNNSISSIPDDISSTDIEIRHELVFVDSGVGNYEQLIDDLNSQGNGSRIFSVFVLDSGKNGIEQITDELQNHEDVDAIHILSHGALGSVSLGNIQLNSANLSQYDRQISLWQNALDQNADILIYGCELVGNEEGEELTTELSLLTGADVAASTDKTGSSQQGGDWELEFSTGVIETEIAISRQTQQSWNGLLAFHTYRDEFDAIRFDNSDGSIDWTISPWQEIGETNGASTGKLSVSEELGERGLSISNSNNGAMREVNLSSANNAFLNFDYARIGLDDPTDSVTLEIYDNIGNSWVSLDSWSGAANDTSLTNISYDISNYIASDTQIRFVSSGLTNGGDKFFIDNFQVAYSSDLSAKAEFLVNQNNTTGVQETSGQDRGSHQSVSVAANGDYVVVWTEVESTGDFSDVFAQQYYANGDIKKAAFQVNTEQTDEQQWASVASDASGRFVVTWTSEGQDGNGEGVYLRRFEADGTAIDTSDVRVNESNTQGDQNNVAVAVNSQGEMVITWQSGESGNEGIFARQFHMAPGVDISNSALTTQLITVDKSTGNATPAVDINTEGKFVITWEKGGYLTYFSIFDSDRAVQADKILTNTVILSFTVPSRYQDVVIQESGDIVIADWSDGVGEVGQGIYLTSYENDGVKIGSTGLLSGSTHIKPSIAKDLGGNISLVYEGDGDGNGSAVIGQRYDSSLNTLGGTFLVNETIIGDQHMASVAMLDLNHFVVAWSGNGTGDADGVFVRQINTFNNPPTLTTFSSEIKNTDKNTEVEITFSELETKGNETDSDGAVDAFVVKNVISGTLTIGNSAGTASAWVAGTNDTIDSINHAYWTPVLNTSGLQNVFTLVAKDNLDKESLEPVTAQIIVNTATSPLITKSDFLVNQTTAGVQETSMENRGSPQAVAIASNGDYVVVWTEVEGSGDYSDIFARQYNADGTAKGNAFQVNDYNAGEQQWATVASDASGRFVITWTSESQDGNGQGVYLKRFNADGIAIDNADILVNTGNTIGNQSNSAVAVNSLGKMVITWQDDSGIFAAQFDMDATTTGDQLSVLPITVDTGSNIYTPGVDINTDGKFVITWGIGNDTYLRTFSSDGNARIPVKKVNENGDFRYQAIAIQESGKFIIADWSTGLDTGNGSMIKGVWVALYNEDGTFSKEHKVSGTGHKKASIAKDSDGNVIIVYQGNGDGDGKGVFAQKYDSNLNAVDGEFLINNTTDGYQYKASIAMLDLDHFVVVWSGNGVGDSNGVFTRQFGTSPPNSPPSADASAGSPYSIYEGESLTLNAANSSDPDSDTLTYLWDLDNDLVYGDAVGENPTINWATLQSNNINDDGIYTIGLKVDDGHGGIGITTAEITVNNIMPILSTTGFSSVALGDLYTLNLSVVDPGADTITEWTINWGDGTIETFAGNPSVVTHTYTNGGFTNNILASATDEDGTYLQNELLVVDFNRESIFRFAPTTGEFISEFGMANLPSEPGFKDPIDIKIGPDGFLYVSSEVSKDILRFNATTGAYHDTFISAGSIPELQSVEGFDFGPDGNLYVADWSANKVIQFNIADGSYMSDFVSVGNAGGNGGLTQPYGVVFGSDGYLYVNSYNGNQIIRYGAEDGIFDKVFVTEDTALLETPEEMVFGPDGKLYVVSLKTGSVVRYDSLGVGEVFIAPNSGSLVEPAGIAFGPDGDVYVSDFADGKIIRYNSDGTFSGTDYVVKGDSNLKAPVFIEFIPGQQVTVVSTNQTPVITGQSFSLPENSPDGNTVGTVVATDPDLGDNLSYTITAGNDLNAFTMSNTGVITIADSNQLDFETNPTFSLTVQVMDDGTGTLSSTATVSINLNPVNEAPVITDQPFTLPENSLDGITVGTVTATDPDVGDNLSYTITAGNDLNAFAISNAGVLTVADSSQLDFEINSTFSLTVQVMDDGTGTLSNTATISINLSQVNEAPVITSQTFTLPENSLDGITVGTVTATDPDVGDNLSYTITAGNDLSAFAMSNAGVLTVADSSQLDFETNPTFSLTVQVMDDGTGTLSSSAIISINLSQVNEAPVITNQSFNLPENSLDGITVGTVTATDPDVGDNLSYIIMAGNDLNAFAMSNAGVLTVADNSQLDFETNSTFNLTIQVMDDGTGTLSSTATVSINLSQVNEAPVITNQSFNLPENSLDGITVGTVTSTDPDVGDNLSYTITAGNDLNAFAISNAGVLTVADSSQLDFETNPIFNLTVQVSDGSLTDTAAISINLTETNELSNSISLSNNRIDEHVDSSTGITIGLLTSSDENAHSYQINGGADQDKFFIGGNANNELFLKDGVLDFEKQSSYQVTVSAIDSKGTGHNETFIVNVNNLNELPVITSSNSFTLEENISSIATVIAEDADQPVQKLSFSLSGGTDSELFLLDSDTGDLSFKTAPDFENPDDSTAENIYIVEITVDDGNGGTYTQSVSIQIENAAEAPDLSDQSVAIEEQSNVGSLVTTLVANDPDANETFSYSIVEGNLSDAFSIDNTGQLIVSNPELLINQDNSIVSVVIQVTDSQGLTDTSVVRIDIQSILPDTSISETESELEKQDEFVFSVLTEIPLEDVTNLTKNETASIPVLNETETIEQAKTEDNTVIENTENIGVDAGQGAVESGNIGIEAETIREKFSVSTQEYSGNKEDNSWTSKNILIKAKALMIDNALSPQFSYFDIETNALKTLMQESGLSERLDELREQIQENTHFEKTIVGSSITLTTGLSIGYVIWLVRGGVLLSSVLSTLPAWRMIDPLPVISSLNGSLGDDDKNADSLASLIKKGSAVVKAKVQASKPPSD